MTGGPVSYIDAAPDAMAVPRTPGERCLALAR